MSVELLLTSVTDTPVAPIFSMLAEKELAKTIFSLPVCRRGLDWVRRNCTRKSSTVLPSKILRCETRCSIRASMTMGEHASDSGSHAVINALFKSSSVNDRISPVTVTYMCSSTTENSWKQSSVGTDMSRAFVVAMPLGRGAGIAGPVVGLPGTELSFSSDSLPCAYVPPVPTLSQSPIGVSVTVCSSKSVCCKLG